MNYLQHFWALSIHSCTVESMSTEALTNEAEELRALPLPKETTTMPISKINLSALKILPLLKQELTEDVASGSTL